MLLPGYFPLTSLFGQTVKENINGYAPQGNVVAPSRPFWLPFKYFPKNVFTFSSKVGKFLFYLSVKHSSTRV